MPSDNDKTLLEKQYKLAIEARDKLNDNFHKWMTYFYVANGAILIAITSVFSKTQSDKGILMLSLIGIFVCTLWHLSCKGYYYWSKSWINIIISLENRVTNEEPNLGVYSVFSKKVADNEDSSWIPNKPANISTPKLTLLLSFFSVIIWTLFSGWQFWLQYPDLSTYRKILIITVLLIVGLIAYVFVLPKLAKSRGGDSHLLI